MKAEDRAPGWQVRCRKCGFTEPWGKYGVRRAAAGTSYTIGWCSQCRWLHIHAIEKVSVPKAPPPEGTDEPRPEDVPRAGEAGADGEKMPADRSKAEWIILGTLLALLAGSSVLQLAGLIGTKTFTTSGVVTALLGFITAAGCFKQAFEGQKSG